MAADFKKDPDETLDYTIDWTNFLDGEQIVTSTWLTPTPVTTPPLEIETGTEANTTKAASLNLKGGKPNTLYTITNRITTSDGLKAERSIELLIVET